VRLKAAGGIVQRCLHEGGSPEVEGEGGRKRRGLLTAHCRFKKESKTREPLTGGRGGDSSSKREVEAHDLWDGEAPLKEF